MREWARPRYGALLPFVLLLLGLVPTEPGCDFVGGHIRPEHFKFVTTVPRRGSPVGGWRVACIHAGMASINTGSRVVCQFQVEVPIRTQKEGALSIAFVQKVCAELANEAAREALSQPGADEALGMACEDFKTRYEKLLLAGLPGARFRRSCTGEVPPVIP